MRRHLLLMLALAAYIIWGAWHWYLGRPVHPADGELAAAEPQQIDVADGAHIQRGAWALTVRAHYTITARVLAREQYHFDRLAGLIPEDLALGWGPMSDNRVLREIDISQSNRFYFWHTAGHASIPKDAIIAHSANTHVIPGDTLIAKQLARLRPGQVVTLTGDLVDAARSDGSWIRTSLVRTDTGAGACEVMLVTAATLQ